VAETKTAVNAAAYLHAEMAEHMAVAVRTQESIGNEFPRLVEACAEALRSGRKLLLFGNGGAAAAAQHIATELVVRYNRESGQRRPLAAIALTTDSLPAGVTIQIDSAGIAGDTLLVPITVDSTAVAGSYTVTFVGSAVGVASDSATYTLVVTAAGGSSGRIGATGGTATLTPLSGTRRTRTAVRRQ
jgi:hypothetical protein